MDYHELEVWQKAHALTLSIYEATKGWPKEELYGLTSQVRRAAVSIGANLAEGQGRYGNAEFARFVRMAAGSAAELEYELLVARDLGYLSRTAHAGLADDIGRIRRMLGSLASRLSCDLRPATRDGAMAYTSPSDKQPRMKNLCNRAMWREYLKAASR